MLTIILLLSSASEDGVTEKMKEIFTSPYNRRALFIGLGLVLFQQVTGAKPALSLQLSRR